MPDILTRETPDIGWENLKSAADAAGPEQEQSYEEVSRKTLEALDKKGWCLWRCRLFDNGVISVVRDSHLFDKQLRFSDPLRIPARYPVFTVDELRYLVEKDDRTIRMVYEAKKLAPAEILIDTGDEEEECSA